MIKESLAQALSEQVNAEAYSAYIYLAMSAWCDRKGFKGISNWLYVQYQEEMAHSLHMYQYILERGASPAFSDIKAPESGYESMQAVFEKVLSHEQWVTERINNIATLAMKENDHAAYTFMQWYVNEQVEEEANADLILQKLINIGGNPALLFTLDNELAARVFIDPFAGAKA